MDVQNLNYTAIYHNKKKYLQICKIRNSIFQIFYKNIHNLIFTKSVRDIKEIGNIFGIQS